MAAEEGLAHRDHGPQEDLTVGPKALRCGASSAPRHVLCNSPRAPHQFQAPRTMPCFRACGRSTPARRRSPMAARSRPRRSLAGSRERVQPLFGGPIIGSISQSARPGSSTGAACNRLVQYFEPGPSAGAKSASKQSSGCIIGFADGGSGYVTGNEFVGTGFGNSPFNWKDGRGINEFGNQSRAQKLRAAQALFSGKCISSTVVRQALELSLAASWMRGLPCIPVYVAYVAKWTTCDFAVASTQFRSFLSRPSLRPRK